MQTASEEQSKEHSLFDEGEREILCGLLRFCLKQLVDGGHAKQRDATGRLARSGQIAAVVQNQMGHAVVLFDPVRGLRAAIWAIPHEAVHGAQCCCGDLKNSGRGTKLWKGKVYQSLASDDPRDPEQPWEAEAFALDGASQGHNGAVLRASLPSAGGVLTSLGRPCTQQ